MSALCPPWSASIAAVLRRVGFFRETEPDEAPDGPSLRDAVGRMPEDIRRPVAWYLMGGAALVIARWPVSDVLDPCKTHIGYPHRLTDGTWEWSEYLAYYVAEYGVGLPAEFIMISLVQTMTGPGPTT